MRRTDRPRWAVNLFTKMPTEHYVPDLCFYFGTKKSAQAFVQTVLASTQDLYAVELAKCLAYYHEETHKFYKRSARTGDLEEATTPTRPPFSF